MNNQFLQHLKSITPQGKAEEKKIFISAERLKELEAEAEGTEELDEATQSKYNKIYGRHVVGGQSKLDVARMKRAAAILRRGGADDETIRKGSDPFNVPMSHYNDVNMARYRFFNKAQRSKEDGKKSPRKSVEVSEGSRGLARHERIVKALKKKAASMAGVPAGERGTAAYHNRFMNKLRLSKGQQMRDRVQISRERMRAGLAPGIPSKTVSPPKGDETGTWRIKSGADRAPKAVLKYRAASAAKAARGGKTQRLFPMTEGVQRMRRLRSARFGQQGYNKELDAAYDKELSKLSASRLRRGGAPKQTIRAFFTDKPTTKAADKAYSKFSKDAMNKASAKGKKIFEATKVGKKIKRKIVKAKNRLRNIGRRVVDTLGTPQDNTDYMLTGRKF
jgi:hypothetical protein